MFQERDNGDNRSSCNPVTLRMGDVAWWATHAFEDSGDNEEVDAGAVEPGRP